jgi:hypothetical protein
MVWARMLAYITGTVDQQLLLQQRCKRSGSRRYLLKSTSATRNILIESNCRARILVRGF